MRIVLFYHSLLSDWNHGNAHFLRGIATELLGQGHDVAVFEPDDAWSVRNIVQDHGEVAIQAFYRAYPQLRSTRYQLKDLDIEVALSNADIVIVHEWNSAELVRLIGEHHAVHSDYSLFFHDTHHRTVTAPDEIARMDLGNFDAVLAFGEVVRRHYLGNSPVRQVFTWHEAADTRKFQPRLASNRGDLVWIGNFGDDERTAELMEFLVEPVRRLGITAHAYGVRYPASVISLLKDAGIVYGGYLPNWEVPRVFAEHRVTLHVPRRPYAKALPGIPTIRPFEAMACGIPLVSAPWYDTEGLFEPGTYLCARDGQEMHDALRQVLSDSVEAAAMTERARANVLSRHTCAHRVAELMSFHRGIRANRNAPAVRPPAPPRTAAVSQPE